MSFPELTGQYMVVPDVPWDPTRGGGRIALFDTEGRPYLPAEASKVDEYVSQALERWAALGRKMTFVSDISSPWEVSNGTVVMTPDGVKFGPYPDSGQGGGTLRFHGLDGQPFSAVKNFAVHIRYMTSGSADLIVPPYLRILLTNASHPNPDDSSGEWSAIHNPHTQKFPGLGPGPFQEFVATAGTWRWNDDAGSGTPEFSLSELQTQYGDYLISKLAVTVGWTQGGYDLSGLLRWAQINGNRYTFGN
jgi:hypothetical protein